LRLTRVSRDSLVSQVAAKLVEAIRTDQVKPGARLIESEIARRLATSRGPVREALQKLTEAGLVTKVPSRGWFVMRPSERELADMVIMRAELEALAAWLIVSRGDRRDLQPLNALNRDMHAAGGEGDIRRLQVLDRKFHEAVCVASRNPFLLKAWHMLRDGIGLIMSSSNPSYNDTDELAHHHDALLEQLSTGTPNSAAALFRKRSLASGGNLLGRDVFEIVLERRAVGRPARHSTPTRRSNPRSL